MDLKSMEMPAKKMEGEEEMEDFDFGFEDAAPMEEATDLSAVSDDDLIKEMKARGFEVEDEPEEDLEAEEPMEMAEEDEELI